MWQSRSCSMHTRGDFFLQFSTEGVDRDRDNWVAMSHAVATKTPKVRDGTNKNRRERERERERERKEGRREGGREGEGERERASYRVAFAIRAFATWQLVRIIATRGPSLSGTLHSRRATACHLRTRDLSHFTVKNMWEHMVESIWSIVNFPAASVALEEKPKLSSLWIVKRNTDNWYSRARVSER